MKKTLLLPVILAVTACGALPEEQAADARAAFAANDFAKARVLAAAALAELPGDRDLLLIQAQSLIALGDGEGATAALDKLAKAGGAADLVELTAEAALLRQAPDAALKALEGATSSEAERLRGMVAIQRGDRGAAAGHLAKAASAGDNARALADMARLRLIERDTQGAAQFAAKAATLAPLAIDTLLVQGQIALVRGDLQAALKSYSAAAQRYPANLAALSGQAATLGDLGRVDEMLAVAERAAKLAPRNAEIAYLRARGAAAKKDWAAVRAVIQPLETGMPAVHPLRPLYAEALLRLGQNQLAAAQLGPIARVQPGNRQVAALLAEARLAAGDARGALAALGLIADSPQARPEELTLAAKAAKAAGDPRASGYAQRASQPAPKVLGADLAEADLAIRQGNWAKAVVAYDRIVAATDGRNIVVLNNLAYAQSMLGNHAKARKLADTALKLAPDNASVLDTAGWVRFRAGEDLETAKRLLGQAARQAPQNQTIAAHLAEATRSAG